MIRGLLKENIKAVYTLLSLLAVGTLLSLSVSLSKFAYLDGIDPIAFLFVSSTIAGCILQIVSLSMGYRFFPSRIAYEYALVTGIVFALTNVMSFLVVNRVGVGYLSILLTFPISITWFLSIFMGLAALRVKQLLGTMLCIAGGVLLSLSTNQIAPQSYPWSYIALLIPIVISVGNIYRSCRWPDGIHAIQLASVMLLSSSALIWGVQYTLSSSWEADIIGVFAQPKWLIGEVIVYIFMYYLFFVVQRLSGPVYISLIGVIASMTGALISVTFLSETISVGMMAAILVIILGLAVFGIMPQKPQLQEIEGQT
ncbi:DMT family transporter [Teredinibacter sp. KSP-S5-2]|uniref:DMT family transporter n=1 Tax=Teredinibacter sp. KSP-S5-2 TaxID=3034506 RepID=UPI002934A027|nr:DMT family transporter [Teredinibacter sp. KSP-S5-2]WNO10756.1 DMT family transporter [Teredinibacter sp. KSP-S5-2]